jgi:hypothetical protein
VSDTATYNLSATNINRRKKMSDNFKQIWDQLSEIDVSNHIEKKGKLSYISWGWCFQIMMDNFPDFSFEFQTFEHENGRHYDAMFYPNNTAMVFVTVHIGDLSRSIWLPCLDYRNKPIEDPNSFDINNAKMRALVKCIALFGLGWSLYLGQDTPIEKENTQDDDLDIDAVPDKTPAEPKTLADKLSDKLKADDDSPLWDFDQEKSMISHGRMDTNDWLNEPVERDVDGLIEFLPTMLSFVTSEDALVRVYQKNMDILEVIEEKFPALYHDLIEAFKNRKQTIKEGDDNG